MGYDLDLYRLSSRFSQDYPCDKYPELLCKTGRPYTCLLIDSHYDYFICVPFRSFIKHKNAFLFHGTSRSKRTISGLDYSKIIIVQNNDYLDSDPKPVVDSNEYKEMIKNLPYIVKDVNDYINTYVKHVNGTEPIHFRKFARKYGCSTLPYFHDILGV